MCDGDVTRDGETSCRPEVELCDLSTLTKRTVCPSFHSLVVSPKLEPSTDPHPPPTHRPPGTLVDPAPLVSPLHHTNPFSHSRTAAPPLSPCNPFFSLLQHNPFYSDMLTAQPLKPQLPPPLPPLPRLSSARPPIAQLFPQAGNPAAGDAAAAADAAVAKSGAMGEAGERPFEGEKPPGPGEAGRGPDSEWDDCFEAFAAGRLQSPEDPHAAGRWNAAEGASLPATDEDEALHLRPFTGSAPAGFQVTGAYHSDTFSQFLETIPELDSFEGDNVPLSNSPDARRQTNQADRATNDPNPANVHQAPSRPPFVKPSSGSPDPGSSGIGSSEAEEDFLSCRSSLSDKFSASPSSEEAEARNVESGALRLERPSDPSSVARPPEEEEEEDDDAIDRSADLSAADVAQRTVIRRGAGGDSSGLEGPPAPLTQHEINATEGAVTPSPDLFAAEWLPETQPKSKEPSGPAAGFNGSAQDFSAGLFDTFAPLADPTGLMTFTTPEDALACRSLRVVTSSPEASRRSPNPFGFLGDFLGGGNIASGLGRDLDGALLPALVSDRSGGGGVFLQSFSASTDSQDYQTCESHQTSKSSSGPEPNETPRSANSTLCGELSAASGALGLEGAADALCPRDEGVDGWDRSAVATLEPGVVTAEAFGFLPAGRDLGTLAEGGVGSGRGVSSAQSAPLNRSLSEGSLAPAFDELLPLPSCLGSDPGAVHEPPWAQPGPRLPAPASFAPCLTPQSRSSPVALFSLPPAANAAVRPPPSTPPKPVLEGAATLPTRQQQAANQENSPHPVKPLTAEERRAEGRSVLEKLKSSIHPGRSSSSSQLSEQEADRKKLVTEGAGSYYHLNHRDLVAMLVQRDAELQRQKAEFERQKLVLAKREVELRKLKPQVKDLEDYIDTLLVRIMEQKPTLLQVRSKLK